MALRRRHHGRTTLTFAHGRALRERALDDGAAPGRGRAPKGSDVNVFAYEGAVYLTVKTGAARERGQGHDVEQEDHPNPKDWSRPCSSGRSKARLDWVNCGLCVDERGAGEWIDGVKRGGPADFLEMAVGPEHPRDPDQ